jgi:hypothetical protein
LTYATLVFGQVFFFLIAFYLRHEWLVDPDLGLMELFKWIVPLFAGAGIYQGNVLFKKRVKQARQRSTFAAKMDDYRVALIVRYAFWGAPSLLAVAAYFTTGEWLFLSISVLIIVVFLTHRPDIDKARSELDV